MNSHSPVSSASDSTGSSSNRYDGLREMARIAGIELTDVDLEQCSRLTRGLDARFVQLEMAVRDATISPQAAAFMAVTEWAIKPDHVCVDYALWASMFRHAGYTEARRRAVAPRKPALLFRGATPERKRGLAWTVDLEQARYFATQKQLDPAAANVWMAWVPPELMLAKYGTPSTKIVVLSQKWSSTPNTSQASWNYRTAEWTS